MPDGDDPYPYRDEVLRRMRELATWPSRPVVLLIENERDIYGDIPRR